MNWTVALDNISYCKCLLFPGKISAALFASIGMNSFVQIERRDCFIFILHGLLPRTKFNIEFSILQFYCENQVATGSRLSSAGG